MRRLGSAARPALLNEPGGHRPALGVHRSAALLDATGQFDWWCAPDFDAPPVLWSVLDPGGAAARYRDVRLVERSPAPAGPSARTVLRSRGVTLECLDALVDEGLVRLVRALDGDLDVAHELSVGGFDRTRGHWDEAGACRLEGGPVLYATSSTGGHAAPDGHTLWTALTVGVDAPLATGPDVLVRRIRALEAEHRRWVAMARLPHPARAQDALAVLRACTYRPTGAVVASPTTSLPEASGADRQFDYRYS